MGGVNAAKENEYMVQKQVMTLFFTELRETRPDVVNEESHFATVIIIVSFNTAMLQTT